MGHKKISWILISLFVTVAYLCGVIAFKGWHIDAITYGFTASSAAHLFTTAVVALTFFVTAFFFVFIRKMEHRADGLGHECSENNSEMWQLKSKVSELERKISSINRAPKKKK